MAPAAHPTFGFSQTNTNTKYKQGDGASPTGDRPGELLTETVFFNREECYSQSQSNCATAAGTEMKNGSHAANAGEIR